MNAQTIPVAPLPATLTQPGNGQHRRHCIRGFTLEPRRIDRFNQVLAKVSDRPAWLGEDQIASAGRCVLDQPHGDACLRQRMWRIGVVAHLLNERDWNVADACESTAQTLVHYARDRDDLIPDSLAHIGRLDDAIVAETAWPRLSAEVSDYMDYRRLRLIEASLRGCDVRGFRFLRADWSEARAALDAATLRGRRASFVGSYVPQGEQRFRVC